MKDGRRVFIGGEKVTDVTEHPASRNAARSFAMLYDKKCLPENWNTMSFEEDRDVYSSWFLIPSCAEDLQKRFETHRRIAEWTQGLLGRSPDHVASFITGLAMKPDMFENIKKGFGGNIKAYYQYMRKNDIFVCYTVLPPQGARKPELYQREGMKILTLRVVDEDNAGVIFSGMKMLGTSAIFSNEAWVGNLLPLAPYQLKDSINCAVHLNSQGISIWRLKPLERFAKNNLMRRKLGVSMRATR